MNEKIKSLPYIGLIIAITLLFFIQFFNYNLPAHDILSKYYPDAQTIKNSFTLYNHIWPLWTPYGFSGTPFLLGPAIGYDSVLGLMLLAVPSTVLALKLTYVILFLLSGITMFYFMVYLKVERRFALVSSLVYMLNGHVSSKLLPWGWLTTLGGYCLIPLVFLFGTKAIKEEKWALNSIITGIIFAVMLRFGPDMKVGLWIGFIFGIYLIYSLTMGFSINKGIKYTLVSLLIISVFIGLSAQRILPAKDFVEKSSRGQTDWITASKRPLKIVDIPKRLIEPGLPKINREGNGDHIGIIAFLLAGLAIFKRWKNRTVLFFSLSGLLSILISNNAFGAYYLLWKYVPFFETMRYMDRSLFIFVFSFSVLAGIGASELFNKIEKKKNLAYGLLIGIILINLWLFNYSHYTGKLSEWHNPEEAIKNNYALQYISMQGGLFRIQTWETHGIDWGTDFFNVPLKLEHIYRYDTTWYPPYMNGYLSVAYNDPAKFWGILNVKYVTARDELNISGLKFIKKSENCTKCYPEIEEFKRAWGPYIYENEKFLPRAYVVNNAILVVGEEESATQIIYSLMVQKEFNPADTIIVRGKNRINEYGAIELKKYSAIILVKDSIDSNSGGLLKTYVDSGGILLPDVTKNKGSFTQQDLLEIWKNNSKSQIPLPDEDVIMHNFDKREVKLNGKYRGFLVFSEKFSVYPGWVAAADGNDKEILNTDAMISSVYVDGSEKSLFFEYKPQSYIIGKYITILTLLALAAYFIYIKFRRAPKKVKIGVQPN